MPAYYRRNIVKLAVNRRKAILQRFFAITSTFLEQCRRGSYAGRLSAIDEVIP